MWRDTEVAENNEKQNPWITSNVTGSLGCKTGRFCGCAEFMVLLAEAALSTCERVAPPRSWNSNADTFQRMWGNTAESHFYIKTLLNSEYSLISVRTVACRFPSWMSRHLRQSLTWTQRDGGSGLQQAPPVPHQVFRFSKHWGRRGPTPGMTFTSSGQTELCSGETPMGFL